jgi:hypothetical protein
MAKSYNLPVMVDTEEGLAVEVYKIDLRWKDQKEAEANSNSENKPWSEYVACRLNPDSFKSQITLDYADFEILAISEIQVAVW